MHENVITALLREFSQVKKKSVYFNTDVIVGGGGYFQSVDVQPADSEHQLYIQHSFFPLRNEK